METDADEETEDESDAELINEALSLDVILMLGEGVDDGTRLGEEAAVGEEDGRVDSLEDEKRDSVLETLGDTEEVVEAVILADVHGDMVVESETDVVPLEDTEPLAEGVTEEAPLAEKRDDMDVDRTGDTLGDVETVHVRESESEGEGD